MVSKDTKIIEIQQVFTDESSKEFEKAAKASDKYCESIKKTKKQADAFSKTKAQVKLSVDDKATAGIKKAKNEAESFAKKTARITLSALDKASTVVKSTENKAKALASRTFRFTIGIVDKATAPLRNIWNYATSLRGIVTTIAAGMAGSALIKAPIGLADMMTTAEIGFQTKLGSLQAAQKMMQDIEQFAIETPFDTSGLINVTQQMMAMGWEAERILPDLEKIGNAAAATGKGSEGIGRITLALSQMRMKGKPSAEEMLQLTEAGINGWNYLADAVGATVPETQKMVEKGLIPVDQAIDAIISGMSEFDGMMQNTANKTASGLMSQLKDTFDVNIVKPWGQGLQEGAINALISMNDWVGRNQDRISGWGESIKKTASQISGALAGAAQSLMTNIDNALNRSDFDSASLGGKFGIVWEEVIEKPAKEWWSSGGKETVKGIAKDAVGIIASIIKEGIPLVIQAAFSNPITGTMATAWGLKNASSWVMGAKNGLSKAKSLFDVVSNISFGVKNASQIATLAKQTGSLSKAFSMVKATGTVASATLTTTATAAAGAGSKIGGLVASLGGLSTVVPVVGGVVAGGAAIFALYKYNMEQSIKPIKDMVDANNELITGSEQLNDTIAANAESRRESIETSVAEAETAQLLSDKLYGLVEQEGQSVAGKEKIKSLVDQLNQTVPGLALAYDEEANKINLSKQALDEKIESMKKEAQVAAIKNVLTEAIEDEIKLEREHNDLIEQREETMARIAEMEAGIKGKSPQEIGNLGYDYNTIREAKESLDELNEAIDNNQGSWENAKTEVQDYSTMLDETLGGVPEKAQESIDNTITAMQEKQPDLYTAGADNAQAVIDGEKSKEPDHAAAGMSAGTYFIGGMGGLTERSRETGKTLAQEGANGAGSQNEEFRRKGESSGNSFVDGIKSAIEGIGGWFSGIADWLNNASGYSGSNIPGHAAGGIMNRPHLGLVAEDGEEAIIPLTAKRRSRGIALWQEAGKRLGVTAYADGGIVGNQEISNAPASSSDLQISMGMQISGAGITADYSGVAKQMIETSAQMAAQNNTIYTGMSENLIEKTEELNSSLYVLWNLTSEETLTTINQMAQVAMLRYSLLVTESTAIMNQMPPQMRTVGISSMNELANGINASKESVLNGASTLVDELLNVFITGLGIHSPSVKMQWIGQMMAAGLIKGLNSDKINKFTLGIIDRMQNSFASGKFDVWQAVDRLGDNVPTLVAKLGVDPNQAASLVYPLIGTMGDLTSVFGYRSAAETNGIGSTNHGGIDLAAPTGTPIAAVLGGMVTIAGDYGGYGNAVQIDHGNGIETLYGHMSSIAVTAGQQVTAGQTIGAVGSTGNSTGPHLHLSMYENGTAIDPLPHIQGAPIMAGNTLASALMAAYNAKKYGISGNFGTYASGGDLDAWLTQALILTGQGLENLPYLRAAAIAESGGNPNAINDWDSNAAAGTPSKGLLQTIDSTFNAYALPGHGDIWNPVDNAIAAIRYMIDRYGSIYNVWAPRSDGWYGYAVGSRYIPQDTLAMVHAGEMIVPKAENPYRNSTGKILPFPEIIRNMQQDDNMLPEQRDNLIPFPQQSSAPATATLGDSVTSYDAGGNAVSVTINLGGISITIDGSNAGSPTDISALLQAQIPGVANDLCNQIATQLSEVFSGMPMRLGA